MQKLESLSLLSPYKYILTCIILATLIFGVPVTGYAAKATDFIPKESIIYAQFNNLDEIVSELSMSENWENLKNQLVDEQELQEMQEGILFIESIIGTDLFSVIDSVGYQIGIAMWQRAIGQPRGGFVMHSGGNLAELQRLTKILTGFIGMSGGTLNIDAGEHRNVKYDTLQMPGSADITYGFVGDFLVVGIGPNSFQKFIDTYRKKSESIKEKDTFVEVFDKIKSEQVKVYCELQRILTLMDDVEPEIRVQFQPFSKIGAGLNLLEVGPLLQVYTKFDSNFPESIPTRFLKAGQELNTLNSLSGDEDLFVAVAPGIMETGWEMIQDALANESSDEAYQFISYLEGLLNLNFEEDVITSLTGEIALSVNDLAMFEPDALNSLDIQLENNLYIDAANVHTPGSLIFSPSKPPKWKQLGNSLSNLQNTSISKYQYKGTDVSVFASNIHYVEKDGLSFLCFSEEQMQSNIDGLVKKEKPSFLKKVPKAPLAVATINLLKLLELTAGAIPVDELEKLPDDLTSIVAWVTVNDDQGMLEILLSDKKAPIQVIAELAPFIVTHLK